jgi:hypothetical protein
MVRYFSIHDLKGTSPDIVHINTAGYEHEENDFRAKQQGVAEDGKVRMQPHARLQLGYPDPVRLEIGVSTH